MIERRKNPDRRISPAIGDFALEERAGLLEQIAKRDARIEKLSLSNDELARMLAVVATKLAALKAQQPSSVVDERAAFEQEFPRSHHASAVYWCEERQRYVGHGDAFENNSSAYQHKFENWKKARARLSPATAGAGVVLPERKPVPDQSMFVGRPAAYAQAFDEAKAHNRCLDEVERLNHCRAQAVPDGIHDQHRKAMKLLREVRNWIIPKGNISMSIIERVGAFLDSAAPSAKKESGDE